MAEPTYLYLNKSKYNGNIITKIGISNNPEKRLSEFNLGVSYRFNHKDNPIFVRFFTVLFNDRQSARHMEKIMHKKYINKRLREFGVEVYSEPPHLIAESINMGNFND